MIRKRYLTVILTVTLLVIVYVTFKDRKIVSVKLSSQRHNTEERIPEPSIKKLSPVNVPTYAYGPILSDEKALDRSPSGHIKTLKELLLDLIMGDQRGMISAERLEEVVSDMIELKQKGLQRNDDVTSLWYPEQDVVPECRALTAEEFMNVNRQRVEYLEEQCGMLSRAQRSSLSTVKEIFNFDKNNISWCPVYKAGSTHTVSLFCPDYFPSEKCSDSTQVNAVLIRTSRLLATTQLQDTPGLLNIVRDPFRRILSAYRNKVMHGVAVRPYGSTFKSMMLHHRQTDKIWGKSIAESMVDEALQNAQWMGERKQARLSVGNPYNHPPYPTFYEFIEGILTVEGGNEHWLPATMYCGPCGMWHTAYIIKMEDYDCEFNHLMESTGNGHIMNSTDKKFYNRGPPVDETIFYQLYSTLTTRQLDNLLKRYEYDCKLYQYDCQRTVAKIKLFKSMNPNYKFIYNDIW